MTDFSSRGRGRDPSREHPSDKTDTDTGVCANCGVTLRHGGRARDNATGLYYCKAFALTGACEPAAPSPDPGAPDDDLASELLGLGPGEPVVAGERTAEPAELLDPVEPATFDLGPAPTEPAPTRGVTPSVPRIPSCPVCLTSLTDEQRCFGCGFDAKKGLRSSRLVRKTKDEHGTRTVLCPSCSYDMGAGASMTCPECGTGLPVENADTKLKRQSRETARMAYLQPALMLAIGGLVAWGITVYEFGTAGLIVFPIVLGAMTLLGTVVFQLMCLTFIGFDAPLHLTVLRLAGIYAVMDVVNTLVALLPLGCLGFIVSLLVYVGMLAQMLEIELNEAIILALGVGVVQILIGVALTYSLLSGG